MEIINNTVNEGTEMGNKCASNKETFMTKIGTGFKKHGKKVAYAALLVVAAGIGYVFGTKRVSNEDTDFDFPEFDGSDENFMEQTEEESK